MTPETLRTRWTDSEGRRHEIRIEATEVECEWAFTRRTKRDGDWHAEGTEYVEEFDVEGTVPNPPSGVQAVAGP